MTETTVTPLMTAFERPSEDTWRALVGKALKGADFEKRLVSKTPDGLRIDPLYQRREDAETIVSQRAGTPWRVSARVDHPEPEAAARQALEDLTNGVDTLTLVFPGSRSARGYGIACDTVDDLDASLKGVDLTMIRLRLDPGPAARLHAAMVAALIEKRGHNPGEVDIEFGIDPIASWTQTGRLAAGEDELCRRLAEAVRWLSNAGHAGPALCVDVRGYHEAGATEAQELAVALATAVAYLRGLDAQGVDLENARDHLTFTMALDADQFMGIAKLRALRRAWARIEEACGLKPVPVRLHGESAWRMLSKRDPWVNMLRTTMATFVAGIGGADSCTALPFSAALGLPDGFARRIARNQQTVLIEESNLWRVSDPAAGAGGYEALTDQLCDAAWDRFQEIEKEGGIIAALASGAIQSRIANAREERARGVAVRKVQLTGTNEFPLLDASDVTVLDVAPLANGLPKASGAAGGSQGFGEIVAAFRSGGTRDEAASANLASDGPLAEPLASVRLGEPFEELRDRADAMKDETGARPAVFMASLGPIAKHTVRSTWIKNLMAAGGIAAEVPAGYKSTQALGDALKSSGARIACIASSDDVYAQMAVDAAKALKEAGAQFVLLAGRPGDMEEDLKAAGVDQFVFAGNDMLALLSGLLDRLDAPAGTSAAGSA